MSLVKQFTKTRRGFSWPRSQASPVFVLRFSFSIMAYGRYTVCRDDPEKNGGHIKSAQMTRSKCLRWISQRPP